MLTRGTIAAHVLYVNDETDETVVTHGGGGLVWYDTEEQARDEEEYDGVVYVDAQDWSALTY